MNWIGQIAPLIAKEFKLELRNKFALGGVLLYVASTVYVVYYGMQLQHSVRELPSGTWNMLFWVVILFAAVNAIAKSFFQESPARQFYLYTLADPRAIIAAKLVYNQVFMLVLTFLAYLLFVVMLGDAVVNHLIFLMTLALAATSFAYVFTLISSIAGKANNNATLMAVLGFPLMIPIIVFMTRLSADSYSEFPSPLLWQSVVMLLALNLILITLSLVLFPYIWRD